MKKYTVLIFMILLCAFMSNAQIATKEIPLGITSKNALANISATVMSSPNMILIHKEDSINDLKATAAEHAQRAKLISRLNALRTAENQGSIEHDTILDNIGKILMFNKKLKKADGTYNEDSVRALFFKNGITDYQYEIYEVLDRDTAEVFNKVFFADKFKYIRIGFYKRGNNNIIVKTKRFLKFDHGSMGVHSDIGDLLHGQNSVKVYVDSVIRYYKILEPDEYYYQFYKRIPSNEDTMQNIEIEQVQSISPADNENYNFIIRSDGSRTSMFLIISGKKNGRVIVTQ